MTIMTMFRLNSRNTPDLDVLLHFLSLNVSLHKPFEFTTIECKS